MIGYCADRNCRCHVGGERERVRTPFPAKLWPEYCCNACARIWAPAGDEPSFAEKLRAASDNLFRRLMRHRDRYVKAWIAATGLRPEESVLVEKRMPNGDVVVTVRRREVGEK